MIRRLLADLRLRIEPLRCERGILQRREHGGCAVRDQDRACAPAQHAVLARLQLRKPQLERWRPARRRRIGVHLVDQRPGGRADPRDGDRSGPSSTASYGG
jgi:hypothetical protein